MNKYTFITAAGKFHTKMGEDFDTLVAAHEVDDSGGWTVLEDTGGYGERRVYIPGPQLIAIIEGWV